MNSNKDNLPEQNIINISGGSIRNLTGSGNIQYNEVPETHKEIRSKDDVEPKHIAPDIRKILFLAANPVDTLRLRLDEELREITEGLQRSKKRDFFSLEQRWAVRPHDLSLALLTVKPHMIHFSGHGSGLEGIALEDDFGNTQLVETEALVNLFSLFANHVECVVLNACYSEVQADAIAKHIPYVIGMKNSIADKTAIEFSVNFYNAISNGESIDFAYNFSKISVELSSRKIETTLKAKH